MYLPLNEKYFAKTAIYKARLWYQIYLQKYRLKRTLSLETGIRRHILKRRSKDLLKKEDRSRNKRKRTVLLTNIQAFLKRRQQ